MSKRLIASIKSSIERIDKKISANEAEAADLINQKEKYLEMLDLIAPKSDLPSPAAPSEEASTAAVPNFLKGQKHG